MKNENSKDFRPYQVMLYVLPSFNLTEFAAVLDVLRIANQISGSILFEYEIMSDRNQVVESSSGFSTRASAFIDTNFSPDLMIFLGGDTCHDVPQVLRSAAHWLKCRKAHIVVLSDAVATLAQIGFFRDQKVSMHWQETDLQNSVGSELNLNQAIFSETGRITTSGGHVATYDVMLNFLAQIHGLRIANLVADFLLKGSIREHDTPQLRKLRDRLGTSDARILRAVEMMEQSVEELIGMADIADATDVSQRQLERLFKSILKDTPNNYYKGIRLKRAHLLLRRTSMPITEIAISTGFASNSSFCRSYKKKFGLTPREYRIEALASSDQDAAIVQ